MEEIFCILFSNWTVEWVCLLVDEGCLTGISESNLHCLRLRNADKSKPKAKPMASFKEI